MNTPTTPAAPAYTVRETTYSVPSATRPGVVYTVREVPGRYECNCPAGQVRRPCWHIKAVVSDMVKPTIRLSVRHAAAVERSLPRAEDVLWN